MTQIVGCGLVAVSAFTAISFVHLRHFWLALAVAMGPFPGLILSQRVLALTLRDKILIAVFCLVLFEFIAAALVEAMTEEQPNSPTWSSLHAWRKVPVFASVVGIVGFALARFLLSDFNAAIGIVATIVLALGSSASILFIAARLVGIGENFIASTNRARERRERLLETITPVAFPRWGFSISGMGLILTVMAFFGAHRAWAAPTANEMLFPAFAAITVVLAASVARDWRRALAVILACAWLGVMGIWISALSATVLRGASLSIYTLMLATALISILAMAAQHRRFALVADAADGAAAQAIVSSGSSTIFAIAGAVGFLLPWRIGGFMPFLPVVMLISMGMASLLLYPAAAAVLESMFFRRAPLEARYKLD